MPNLLTIDVEDWFQVENFSGYIIRSDWDNMELRINKNIDLILELLNRCNTKATFFVLGWIAERLPELIKKISNEGHEIACHGFNHSLTYKLKNEYLENDILTSKKLLESITGTEIVGYRAPSFTISESLLEVLAKLNFHYDSSLFYSHINKNYGRMEDIKTPPKNMFRIRTNLYEFPMSSYTLIGFNIPWSGGFMFRAVPFFMYKKGIEMISKQSDYFLFYIHPWEFDLNQPRVNKASISQKFKHYYNIKNTLTKFERLLNSKNFCSINHYLINCPKL
jgi:polysaccharide deacetylase family protein (PEP-CTERM system associated)